MSQANPFDIPKENQHKEMDKTHLDKQAMSRNRTSEDSEDDNEWWNDERMSESDPTETAGVRQLTQWPSVPEPSKPKPAHIASQITSKKTTRRYSVQKPARKESKQRQRIQNAKAGIKVVTNFSRHQGPPPIMKQHAKGEAHNVQQGGMFVDLAALQALDKENQSSNNNPTFWTSMKGRFPQKTEPNHEQSEQSHPRTESDSTVRAKLGSRRARGLVPPPIKLEDDLSPNDRPIFIGLSVPSAKAAQHVTNSNLANSQPEGTDVHHGGSDIPETPTIIITPAQNPTTWDPLDSGFSASNPRAASSVYSYATKQDSDAPPMPNVSKSDWRSQDGKKVARDSVGTIFDEDMTPASPKVNKNRIMSSCTIFEEDSTPILAKASNLSPNDIKHTSISPLETRDSRGWWNYITTPFLTRSNTLASPKSAKSEIPPALPSLEIATAKAANAKDIKNWEKSAFSPLTPETTTTISSDTWWDRRNTLNGMEKDEITSPNDYQTYDSQSGTLPFMLAPSQTVLDRSRNITNKEPMPANMHLGVQRDPSTRSGLSPSDREAPVMLDVGSLGISNVQVQNSSTVNVVNQTNAAALPATQPAIGGSGQQRPIIAGLNTERRDSEATTTGPPPYSPPRRDNIPRYRAVFPPGHPMNLQEPPSPGPVSPGLQRAMGVNGNIQMSEVPLTPATRRPINLNSGYTPSPRPVADMTFAPPPTKALKAEKKRKRYEKEDAVAHRAGGLWRGRGCVPTTGCYGRSGREGRQRRRCWFGLIAGFLAMVILIIVLATQLHHHTSTVQTTQWLNLTGYPPIFTGISTVAGPDNPVANTACVFPATMWSCALPKELQQTGSDVVSPNFRLQIQWDNSTEANSTFANVTGNSNLPTRGLVGNAVSAGQFIKRMALLLRGTPTFVSSPAPPSLSEQAFLGNSTDGIVSNAKAGEATPFYVSFLSTTSGPGNTPILLRRDDTNSTLFPNLTSLIPAPSLNSDGTAAAANLVPLPVQQPIRLYDRGLPTEHYGFYSYFDRSIFLKSVALLNASNIDSSSPNTGEVPEDMNGGSSESAAKFRCTWAQTRFLVQMWTGKNGSAALLNATSQANFLSSASNYTAATANDFQTPGSFPYPVTVTVDRHGGDVTKKMIYCYQLDAREQVIAGSEMIWPEHRDAGGNGIVVNPAPPILATSSGGTTPTAGGFDGGNTGCSCQWQNWKPVVRG